jgi:hypothetical protein
MHREIHEDAVHCLWEGKIKDEKCKAMVGEKPFDVKKYDVAMHVPEE